MSTHNIFFYGELTKIIPKLSPYTLRICSTKIMIIQNILSQDLRIEPEACTETFCYRDK